MKTTVNQFIHFNLLFSPKYAFFTCVWKTLIQKKNYKLKYIHIMLTPVIRKLIFAVYLMLINALDS